MYQYTNMGKKPSALYRLRFTYISRNIHLLGLYNSCLFFQVFTLVIIHNIKRLKIWSSKHDSRTNDNKYTIDES